MLGANSIFFYTIERIFISKDPTSTILFNVIKFKNAHRKTDFLALGLGSHTPFLKKDMLRLMSCVCIVNVSFWYLSSAAPQLFSYLNRDHNQIQRQCTSSACNSNTYG